MGNVPERRVNAQGDHGVATIKVTWTDPHGVPMTYANIFMSQFTPSEFILSFGQVIPPNTIDLKPEEIANLSSIDGVTVTRFALTPERMEELIETLQRNWEQYQRLLGRREDEE